MEKYILQILEKNSRVIVPEFGAFIVKQKSPLTIVFNEFLQYNDGMLVDALAKGDGIGRDEAKDRIDAFVKDINASLDKNGKFAIEELGLLVKNSAGKISLDASEQEPEAKKPKAKAATPEPEPQKSEDEKPEKPAATKAPSVAKTEDIPASRKPIPQVPKHKQTEKPTVKEEAQQKSQPAAKSTSRRAMVKSTAEKAATPEKKETEPLEKKPASSPTPVSNKEPQQSETPKKTAEYASFEKRVSPGSKPEKKNSNRVLLWVAIIVLVNAAIFAIFYFNGYLDGLFGSEDATEEVLVPIIEDEPLPETENAPAMDPMIEEEILETEPVPLAPPVRNEQSTISGRKYYIVAGVFSIESNADNLARELTAKGYQAEKFGKIGNMYAVCYGVYSSRSEANKALAELKQNENPQAWLKVVD